VQVLRGQRENIIRLDGKATNSHEKAQNEQKTTK
jgi:hypothetical protein